jgi:hypothetical protein
MSTRTNPQASVARAVGPEQVTEFIRVVPSERTSGWNANASRTTNRSTRQVIHLVDQERAICLRRPSDQLPLRGQQACSGGGGAESLGSVGSVTGERDALR